MIPKSRKRAAIWSDVPDAEWNDWHWQHKNRIRSLDMLEKVIAVSDDERRAYDASVAKFNMAITPYYASLMDPKDPNCPVLRLCKSAMFQLPTRVSDRILLSKARGVYLLCRQTH